MRCKVRYGYEQIIAESCSMCLSDILPIYNKLNDAEIKGK